MDKYIGNKKTILENIEEFMLKKKIKKGVFFDAFTGTTNVAQYFKQRGFGIISNDINEFSYVLQSTYIKNNTFPSFKSLMEKIENDGYQFEESQLELLTEASLRKIINDKIYNLDYDKKTNYIENIGPLVKVISYLNSIEISQDLSFRESFFYDYYTIHGKKADYRSSRGTIGKRNYFSENNAKKVGVLLEQIRCWFLEEQIINQAEFLILLTAIIEEVTLIANVNGTFHDFNRKKLYPNAVVEMKLKAPVLNISSYEASFNIYMENSNELRNIESFKTINKDIDVLYIDPPYNFRQYSSYYHLLNLIAKYHKIDNMMEYGNQLAFVRGQNMKDDIKSDYCYKDSFAEALSDLIQGIASKHVLISYYDENNHWNHGKEVNTDEGRRVILDIFRNSNEFENFDSEPYLIKRKNYQSQNGHKKKKIDELIFYAKKR